jgi:hypothetical protein
MISLERIKKHLNIDDYFVDDDLYLLSLRDVAIETVERDLGFTLYDIYDECDCTIPEPIKQAILLMIGTFYNNRESIAAAQLHPIPLSYQYLLDLYRKY